MKSCAVSNLKKASLELGGKSPLIIFGDFDLDKAVRTAMGACYFNKGENCIAAGKSLIGKKIIIASSERPILASTYISILQEFFEVRA